MSWNTIKTVKSSPIWPLTLKSLKLKLNKISWQVVHKIWTARIGINFFTSKKTGMKKCIFWTVASAILLLGSCNKEEIQDPTPQEVVTVPTLTIRAAMPDENPSPQTRVALTETVGGNLSVQWKEGDKIHL